MTGSQNPLYCFALLVVPCTSVNRQGVRRLAAHFHKLTGLKDSKARGHVAVCYWLLQYKSRRPGPVCPQHWPVAVAARTARLQGQAYQGARGPCVNCKSQFLNCTFAFTPGLALWQRAHLTGTHQQCSVQQERMQCLPKRLACDAAAGSSQAIATLGSLQKRWRKQAQSAHLSAGHSCTMALQTGQAHGAEATAV